MDTQSVRPREVLQGDCLVVLPTLQANHFHCVVTSPPYFSLRSYLPKDHPLKAQEIGSEPTPEAFIETMMKVFREVRRVLHPSGLLFLNLGDSYNQYNAGQTALPGTPSGNTQHARPVLPKGHGLASADRGVGHLLNMPHRVAEALRADGWHWRQTIVWAKKSPMPESVRGWRWERCRVKVAARPPDAQDGKKYVGDDGRAYGWSPRHDGTSTATWSPCPGCAKCEPHQEGCRFCDATGIDRIAIPGRDNRDDSPCPICGGHGTVGYVLRKGKGRCTTAHEFIFVMSKSPLYFWDSAAFTEESIHSGKEVSLKEKSFSKGQAQGSGRSPSGNALVDSFMVKPNRNPRSVWLLSSEPTSVAHFATYPSELVRRCIQAGTSDGGCCPECGEPWAPVVESTQLTRERPRDRTAWHEAADAGHGTGNRQSSCGNTVAGVDICILGYRPTCGCRGVARGIDPLTGNDTGKTLPVPRAVFQPAPCRVLDPFAGIGTTIQTARWMKRDSVGIELNPEYAAIAEKLIDEPPRWWRRKHNAKPRPKDCPGQGLLF